MPPTSRCLLLVSPLSLYAAMDSCPVRLYWFNISIDLYGVSHIPTTYHTAYNCCSSQASRLRLTVLTPNINSSEVFKAMAKYPLQNFWIDAMKKGSTYFWPDGSSVLSSLWSLLEPSLLDDCARLDASKGGLAGWPCSSSSFNVFCQGHTPKASVRINLANQCSLNFTWMPISDWMYGISTIETDYWTARNCCTTYGPYFRLAVLGDEINVTTTLAYLQQTYISGGFWVDASRPNFDSSQDFVWSNGKPVNSDLWSNTNNWYEPSPGDVIAALELNRLTQSPKLFGTTVNASSPSYFALCQEWFSFTDLTTLTTALTSPVSEVSTTTSFQSTPTTHTTTEENLSTVIDDGTSVSSIRSNEVSKQSYVSETASPLSIYKQETSTLTLLSQTEGTSPTWVAYPTTETSTQSTSISGVPFKSCACRCAFNYSRAYENLDEKVKEIIQLDLRVNKANLSSTRRKRNSQKDNRRSSSTIGVTGVVVVVVVSGVIIVFHDLCSLLCTIVTHWKSNKSQRIQPTS